MVNTFLLCLLSIALIAIPLADSAAYCTYHNYNSGDSLTTVACSDGINGIMTKFGYSNLSPMYPYVTAFSGATWNSPNCGRCVRLTSGGRTVHLTVIDQCGPAPGGYDAHFDIAPPAFRELFGDAGVNAGVQPADWQFVDSSNCQGNKGNTGGSAPTTPTGGPAPVPTSASSTRCGLNWGDANGKCGTPCQNDGPCAGQRCYADLSMAPCNRALADTETEEGNFVDDVSMNTETETDNFVNAAVADVEEEDNYVDNFGDAAVADASLDDDSNFVTEDQNSETETDNFVDTAVADVEEEEDNYVDNYVDAAVADVEEDNYADNFDAAVAGEGSSLTQQTQSKSSTGMQGWMIAIIVMFSITTVLLLVVIVLAVSVLRRKH